MPRRRSGGGGPGQFHRQQGSMSDLAQVALIQDAGGLRTHVQLTGGVDPRALLMLPTTA